MSRPDSAWDHLLDRLDQHAATGAAASPVELTELVVAAQQEGLADRELDPQDAAGWLVRLLVAHDGRHPRDDAALSTLRVIVTRWLHPPRLDLAERTRHQTFGP